MPFETPAAEAYQATAAVTTPMIPLALMVALSLPRHSGPGLPVAFRGRAVALR